jgi:hypothetical protein
MNIDLLPFNAFALESYGPTAPSRGDPHTLTLELALSTGRSSRERMSGSVSTNPAGVDTTPLRAAILPADGSAITITF